MMQLTNASDVQEYALAILEAQTAQLQEQIDAMKACAQSADDFDARLYTITSAYAGYTVTAETFDTVQLTRRIWNDIFDEACEKKDCLIRPSHNLMPYSLVRQNAALGEYIPVQNPKSALELLSDRSTSRAYEIIKEYSSHNTQRAYMGDLVYWQAWLSAMGHSFYAPIITEAEVVAFIVQHAEGLDAAIDEKLVAQGFKGKLGPHRLSTIKRRLASLSIHLEQYKLENQSQTEAIRQLLQKLTKKYGGSKPAGKAITKDILDDMLSTCGDKLIDVRDKALLLFAWASGGRRRTEIATADIKDLTKTPEGDFTYNLPRSKTDQEGSGYTVPVKGRAAQALQAWITTAGITEGPLFRSIAKGGGKIRGALSDFDIHRIVRLRLKRAGYDETLFGAHSLRSGFVTEAGRRGKPIGDVMQLTTHRNVETVMKYYQAGNIINNSASNLAD
jgi:integrase